MTHSTKFPGLRETASAVAAFVILGKKRRDLLESHGWYRNMTGGWTHPHCLDFMSWAEIRALTPGQLAYKLHYGSKAVLPKNIS